MAIKFTCDCGQVLNVPDRMAGKQGKCPKCQKNLKVPTTVAPVEKSRKKAKSAAAPAALDSLFDDAGLVKKSGPVCPNCAASIKPGAVVCTGCGMNFQTGEKIRGFNAKSEQGPEFDNLHLQTASDNMKRDLVMESRREKSAMPWWVLASYLIGAVTLCAAGVVIVDGLVGTPAVTLCAAGVVIVDGLVGTPSSETTFIGKVQRLPVFCTLGLTAGITGIAITTFAHLSICFFAFGRSVLQGLACFFVPLLYSVPYGLMNWTDNKAPVKAIMSALVFIGIGVFMILQGGGFGRVQEIF